MQTVVVQSDAPPPPPPAPSSPRATSSAATARATPPSTPCAASRSTSPQGRLTAVMGPSGSGKSTLMHILAGLDQPTSGEVTVAGVDITRLDDAELTLAAPRPHRLHLPVLQPAPDAHGGREHRAAAQARRRQARPGVARRAGRDRSASATGSAHRPSELSGGQQQRVAVARALVSRPSVMFADEPTGNLDSTTSGEILALLRDSVDALGQTTVMVTHDAHAAAIADRVLFLADGDIVRDLGRSTRARDPRDARAGERPMIGVALKGLAGRKIRALLTAFAVVIGVSMVSGTFILTDTMQKSFDGLFEASYDEDRRRHPAARRSSRTPTSGSGVTLPEPAARPRSGRCPRSRPPAAPCRRQEANSADIIGKDGKAVAQESIGTQLRRRQRAVQPAQAQDRRVGRGRRAGRDRRRHGQEGALRGRRLRRRSTTAAGSEHLRDRPAPRRSASVDSLGFGSIAVWDLETAQKLLDREGRFDGDLDRREARHLAGRARRRRPAARPRQRSRSRTAPSRRRRTPQEVNEGMGYDPRRSCSASAASRCSSARS